MKNSEMASHLQYTLVNPAATKDQVVRHLKQCAEHRFHAAMIPMYWVPLARRVLAGTPVRIATFICIGMGNESIAAKCMLLRECWALGADEVDYQPNMSLYLSDMHDEFAAEGRMLVGMSDGRPIKAMLELGYIRGREARIRAARILAEAGVPWIKNSSGVGEGSEAASVENVSLLKSAVEGLAKVKASGKIRTREQAEALLAAGAELLGTSAGPEIIGSAGEAHGNY